MNVWVYPKRVAKQFFEYLANRDMPDWEISNTLAKYYVTTKAVEPVSYTHLDVYKRQYKHSAGTRDGAMACLIGIAARKSIEEHRPVKIDELTTIQPHPTRGV